MWILVLEPAARDQHSGVAQRGDHRVVGVALGAGFGEHAFPGKSRRILGEACVGIDRERDRGVDAAALQIRLV